MFKKLIEKHNQNKLEKETVKLEKKRNKPQFEISQLYVGGIVLYKERIYKGNDISNYLYYPVKKFAIFTQTGASQYLHIKSKQKLHRIGLPAIEGDYAVIDVKTFQEQFPIFMRKYNLDLSNKVSIAFVEEFEDEINNRFAPNQKVVDLFK